MTARGPRVAAPWHPETVNNAFDSITIEQLREQGSLKWTHFPEKIGAFVAEMDFGTAPVVSDALRNAIDKAQFGYLPQHLADDLAQAAADWHRESYGWDVDPTRVHHASDVLNALAVTIDHYSTPGSPVIVLTPSYMPFLRVPKECKREIIEVHMTVRDGRYEMDLDAIDAAFKAGGNLFVLCNPFNPVGRVFSADELLALSEVVERNGGRVFSDEIHAPLVYKEHKHVSYANLTRETAAHTVTATSVSKAWNIPGLKCAQIILSNDADVETWVREAQASRASASTLGVIASIAAYREGREWLDSVIEYLDGNRRELHAQLAEHLPEIVCTVPEGTYIAWLDARALGLDNASKFFADNADVALTDGASCGVGYDNYMRFIFATPRPVIVEAVKRMAAALRG